MNSKQKNHVDRFFLSWNKLNDNKSAFECEKEGSVYKGINHPQVQIYWRSLKSHERLEIAKIYGLNSEKDVLNLFTI